MAFAVSTRYNFLSRFYKLASVSVLSNMMIPLAGMVDIAFIGHLPDLDDLAGVIVATILFDYLYRVLKFLRASVNALTAQSVGLNDSKAILLIGIRSCLIALGIGLVILLLQYPLQKIGFSLLSGSSVIESSGMDYFNARIWGAPAVLINIVLIGWFMGREMNGIVLLMSLIGNGSNIVLDYVAVVQLGWNSMGVGLATAFSQYLALFAGLICVGFSIPWRTLISAFTEVFDWVALKDIVVLKSNILIRFLVLSSTYAIFTNISATMGTATLAENGLLLQIVLLSQFTIQGVGMTTETLTGNFRGKGNTEQMSELLSVSVVTSLPIALAFAAVSILFPDTVFGLLTSHTEVSQYVRNYSIWLLPLLGFTAIAFILEGYYIGLKEGVTLRNAVLLAFGLGFLPLAITAWYLHHNPLLWMSLVSYMTIIIVVLGIQLPRTFGSQN